MKDHTHVEYKKLLVDGLNIFYREAGDPAKPTLLLLHGYPSSSHMFRHLIPKLSDGYHVVAPDLPGFGLTDQPPTTEFKYTYDNIASLIDKLLHAIKVEKYALYIFDYGGPIGYRLALKHPDCITAIVAQSANAYLEGLNDGGWNAISKYWKDQSQENRDALRMFVKPETTKWVYTEGVRHPELIAPESYMFDQIHLDREGNVDIQLDLFFDYKSNLELYPAIQEYLRTRQPPMMVLWGNGDPFFLQAGAEAYRRDVKDVKMCIYNAGHFLLETHGREIGMEVRQFFDENVGYAAAVEKQGMGV
jgi:pimeloyl-ACP methyl ester carboxylesterase